MPACLVPLLELNPLAGGTFAMDVINRILRRLEAFPDLVYSVGSTSITLDPRHPEGFPVSLEESPSGWLITADGWHGHFDDPTETLDFFWFVLSIQCRLRVDYRGKKPVCYALEQFGEGGWLEVDRVGRLIVGLFGRKRSEYRQFGSLGRVIPRKRLDD
jgi:hypothetical protein